MSSPPRSAERTAPFSQAIRAATEAAHADAEQAPFLSALLDGRLGREGLVRLTAQHLHLYRALEDVADAHASDPVVAPFLADELRRVPALEADLAALVGPGWEGAAAVALPATVAYGDRIREVGAAGWSGGVVAHHYTRYLGDLSGGLFIGRRLDDVLGIEGHRGTSFYVFDAIADPTAFKDRYRRTLDEAPWDDAERARIIDEVLLAYRHNTAVFDELGGESS